MEDGSPGGTALLLFGALVAALRARGVIDASDLLRDLELFVAMPGAPVQSGDAENARDLLSGMLRSLPDPPAA